MGGASGKTGTRARRDLGSATPGRRWLGGIRRLDTMAKHGDGLVTRVECRLVSGGVDTKRQSGENRCPPPREFTREHLCLSKAILAWPAGTYHGHRTGLGGTQFSVDEQKWWSSVNLEDSLG